MREPLPARRSFGAEKGFETMARTDAERQEQLATDIRRQIGDRSMTRFLGAMPAYKVVSDIPSHLKDLLERLEASERPQASASRS